MNGHNLLAGGAGYRQTVTGDAVYGLEEVLRNNDRELSPHQSPHLMRGGVLPSGLTGGAGGNVCSKLQGGDKLWKG